MIDKLNRLSGIIHRLKLSRATVDEAITLIHEIKEDLVKMPDLTSYFTPKLALQLIEKYSSLISDVNEKLTKIEVELRNRRFSSAEKTLIEVNKLVSQLVAMRSMLMSGVNVVPSTGLVSPVNTTQITTRCGGVASRIYGYIVRLGKVPSKQLSVWMNMEGIDPKQGESALSCLLNRGYLITESEGGEIYYRPLIVE